MAPQRTPLGLLNNNPRYRGPELSPNKRGRATGMCAGGMSEVKVAVELEVSRRAVRNAKRLAALNTEGRSLPRSGRPRVYTDRDNRTMLRNLRLFPKNTFETRRRETGLGMSNTYIKNLARASGLAHWRAKKRPELSEKVAAERLLWCKVRAHWTVEQWKEYIWSDECSAEKGKGKGQIWVWGTPSDKWKPSHVTTYKKGKQLRVMVWGAFWGESERTPLYIMDRDYESLKQGYSANSYLEVLDNQLLEIYHNGLTFMQDNAPIHTADKVKDWFYLNGVRVTDWPPYSPDLNPIEHAWKALKEQVAKMYPDLWNAPGESEEDILAMEEALQAAWEALPNTLFEALVGSIPDRIQACIDANGWHTKY